MAATFALMIGLLAAAGAYLVLRADRFRVVLGLTLLSYAVNLFILASGEFHLGVPPLVDRLEDPLQATDPLPQALVLTAIVIGFGMTAWLIALGLRMKPDAAEPVVPDDEVVE